MVMSAFGRGSIMSIRGRFDPWKFCLGVCSYVSDLHMDESFYHSNVYIIRILGNV